MAQEHRRRNLRRSFQKIPRAVPFFENLRFRSIDLDSDCRSKSSIVAQNSECYKNDLISKKDDFKFSSTGRQGVNGNCLQRLSVLNQLSVFQVNKTFILIYFQNMISLFYYKFMANLELKSFDFLAALLELFEVTTNDVVPKT